MPFEKSNVDWYVVPITTVISSAVVAAWFFSGAAGTSRLIGLKFSGPFLPMSRYPVEFLLLGAINMMVGGLSGILSAYVQGQTTAIGASVFFPGIAAFLVLLAWTRPARTH
jgi:hypothetical protein